jgi:hypothetical protein
MAAPTLLTGTHWYFLIKLSFPDPDGWQSRQVANSAGAGRGKQWEQRNSGADPAAEFGWLKGSRNFKMLDCSCGLRSAVSRYDLWAEMTGSAANDRVNDSGRRSP